MTELSTKVEDQRQQCGPTQSMTFLSQIRYTYGTYHRSQQRA